MTCTTKEKHKTVTLALAAQVSTKYLMQQCCFFAVVIQATKHNIR